MDKGPADGDVDEVYHGRDLPVVWASPDIPAAIIDIYRGPEWLERCRPHELYALQHRCELILVPGLGAANGTRLDFDDWTVYRNYQWKRTMLVHDLWLARHAARLTIDENLKTIHTCEILRLKTELNYDKWNKDVC
jgi:hypothetical protein